MQAQPQPPNNQRERSPDDSRHGSGSERYAKRLKVKRACRECRDRKTRCDGGQPICDSCLRRKLPADQCVYSTPRDDASNSYVTSLKSRVQVLESLLSESAGPHFLTNFDSRPTGQWPEARPGINETSSRGALSAAQLQNSEGYSSGVSSSTVSRFQYQPSHVVPPAAPASTTSPGIDRSAASQEDASSLSVRRVVVSQRISERQGHDAMITHGDDGKDRESDSGPEDSPSFLGSSSAVGFMTEVRQTLKPTNERLRSNEGRPHASPDAEFRSKSSWFGNSEQEDHSLNLSPPEFVIPPRHTADMLLNSYWSGAHPLQPFLYRPSFTKRYECLWNSTAQVATASLNEKFERTMHSEQIFHCKLNLAFALGCRFRSLSIQQSDPHLDKSQTTFAARATRLLNLELMDTGTIDLVQALLLMAQYLQTMNLSNRCWVVVGMAIRVAQGVALHLDIAGESQAQREERRKTWYFCILLDRVLSMTFGRPLMLENPCLGPLPQMVDDEYLTSDPTAVDCSQPPDTPARTAYYVCILKLSNITAEILRLMYTLTAAKPSNNGLDTEDYNSLLRLDSKLLDWQKELPLHLRYNRDADISNPNDLFLRQSHLLHHRFLNSRILLFRRVLVQVAAGYFSKISATSSSALQQTLARACVDICTAAAQDLLDILQPNIGTWLVPPAWFTVFLIYTAGTVLAVVFLTSSFRSSSTLEQKLGLRRSWDQCIECLAEYRRLGAPAASKCLSNLQKMCVDDEGVNHQTEISNTNAIAETGEENTYQTSAVPSAWRSQGDRPDAGFGDDAEFYNYSLPDLWWPYDNPIDLST